MKQTFNCKLLSSNEALFRPLTLTDTITLLQGMEKEAADSKLEDFDNVISFVAVDEQDLTLRVVFCGVNATDFRCQTLHKKELIEEGQQRYNYYGKVNSLQVQDGKIMVVLPSRIYEFEIANVKNVTNYTYTRSMKFVQYFNNKWYGISTGHVLFLLEHLERTGELIETSFFTAKKKHHFEELVATESHLLARYQDESGSSGFAVYYHTTKDFFGDSQNLTASSIKQDFKSKLECNEDGDYRSSINPTLYCLDFEYPFASALTNYYEWNDYLIVFGAPGALMMSLPPTLEAPNGKNLLYQTVGTFNQSFVFEGNSLIHLLPGSEDTSKCAAITSSMLRTSQLQQGMQKNHLFINSVEPASPMLSFEKLSDSQLELLTTVKIDLYYKKRKDTYLRRSYTIGFKNYKVGNWIWLWIAMVAIVVAFLGLLCLCIAKSLKAIKKGNNYSVVEQAGRSDQRFSEEPLLNDHVPTRLVGQSPLREY